MRRSMAFAPENIVNRSTAIRGFEAGIGITRFLKGKSFFITGATGFLSKVLIEKILRTTPDVNKIYVLIKAKNKEAAFDRLKNEIINIEIFKSLQEIHGCDFQEFMFNKLIPVIGDMTKAKLGIDAAMTEEISQEVNIIVHSAANTTFDERANIYGWQDVYVFTKAMAEMVINSMRDDIPVVTIRPSVIESTWKEPFPGWIEGNRMVDPLILYYGKGQLSGFLGAPKGVLDVVPVDMVVNAILAAIAKHGRVKKSGIHTYHIASSIVNPLVIEQLSTLIYRHFNSLPCIDSKGRPIEVHPLKLFDDLNELSDHVHSNAIRRISLHEKMSEELIIFCLKLVDRAKYLAYIYEPYTFYCGRFDNTNTQKLIDEMSEEERIEYCFDVGEVDWEDYILNIHIPGLRRHVMKGRGISANNSQFVGAQVRRRCSKL